MKRTTTCHGAHGGLGVKLQVLSIFLHLVPGDGNVVTDASISTGFNPQRSSMPGTLATIIISRFMTIQEEFDEIVPEEY